MKARLMFDRRVVLSETIFVELVLWEVPQPVDGSDHRYKYRLAFVVEGQCVLRYDNEVGKGDHKHIGGTEMPFTFENPDQLIADFFADVARWQDENRQA
jgi:hypothetical protein